MGGRLSGGQAVWEIGDLGVNHPRSRCDRTQSTVSVEDVVANQARVSGVNLIERLTDDLNRPGQQDPTLLTVIPAPQLLFTKSIAQDEPTARPGDAVRYLIVVRNIGIAPVNNLIVTDRLPAQLRPVSATENGQIVGDEVTWVIPALLPNAERTLILGVNVSPNAAVGEQLDNQAAVSSADGLSQLSDDPNTVELTDPTSLRVIGEAELRATKRAVALDYPPFRRGGRVRYEIELSQVGTIGVTDVAVGPSPS